MATTLSAGDLAIVNYNSDDPDSFAFVLLKDIEAGTQINFTDNGWKAAGGFLPGEGTATYTAATDVAAGTVIEMTGAALADVQFNVNGDQIIAYQGSAATPTPLYAIDFADSDTSFAGDATNTITSAVPTGLTLGSSAAAFGQDNGVYTGPTSGTRAELLAAIADPSNWTLSNTTRQAAPAGPFDPAEAIAQNDTVSVSENGTVNGNALDDNGGGADSDPNGDTLTVTQINGVAANVGSKVTLGSGAEVTLSADGTFVYDPNGKFDDLPAAGSGATNPTASDSFTYTLAGGDTATVTITVNGVDSDGDALQGDASDNSLNGGIGADVMTGLGGNDTYFVDNANDAVVEIVGGGSDDVRASVSYALADGVEVEALATVDAAATTAIDLRGNAFQQTIEGNAGNNTLHDGGTGPLKNDGVPDTLTGHGGDDVYVVYDAEAVIVEVAGEGHDRLASGANMVLGEGISIEYLCTSSQIATYAIDLTGNSLAQWVRGSAGANVLDGRGGGDTLWGMGGADSFRFSTTLGSGNVDRIADFSVADDVIQLDDAIFAALGVGPLDASAFKDIGVAARDADDHILYNSTNGSLFYAASNSGTGFVPIKFAALLPGLGLTAADFVVV